MRVRSISWSDALRDSSKKTVLATTKNACPPAAMKMAHLLGSSDVLGHLSSVRPRMVESDRRLLCSKESVTKGESAAHRKTTLWRCGCAPGEQYTLPARRGSGNATQWGRGGG